MKISATAIASVVVGIAALVGFASTSTAADTNDKKVTICHFTSSATNPYVVITISKSALETHLSHHDDRYAVDGKCSPDNPGLGDGSGTGDPGSGSGGSGDPPPPPPPPPPPDGGGTL